MMLVPNKNALRNISTDPYDGGPWGIGRGHALRPCHDPDRQLLEVRREVFRSPARPSGVRGFLADLCVKSR